MWTQAFYALIIFVVFAAVGGLAVRHIIRNQQEPGSDDLPPRGVPWDSPENRD